MAPPGTCVKGPKFLQRLAGWGDANPIKYTWTMVAFVIVPLAVVSFMPLVVAGFVANFVGIVGLAAFESIEKATQWLENLQTSLWYVQMSSISFLEGKKMWTECGGFFGLLLCFFANQHTRTRALYTHL